MPWFRLEDTFHSHPKVLRAGNEAVGLFVRCGTYAAQHLTDGFIPEDIANLYGATSTGSRRDGDAGKAETLAETLVSTGLWRRVRGGWKMRDYLEYNPSKQAVDNERRQKAERQKRWREAQRRRVTHPSSNAVGDAPPPRPAPTKGGGREPAPGSEQKTLTPPAANGRADPTGPAARGRRPEDRSVAEAIAAATPKPPE